jgi:hypothetical protein
MAAEKVKERLLAQLRRWMMPAYPTLSSEAMPSPNGWLVLTKTPFAIPAM